MSSLVTLNGRSFHTDDEGRPIWALLEEVLRDVLVTVPEEHADRDGIIDNLTRMENAIQDGIEHYTGKATLRWFSDAAHTGIPWAGRVVLTTNENITIYTVGHAHRALI